MFEYEYPRAAITVDCVVFGLDETDLKVLLIQRKLQPFQHAWALPGGFVRVDETLDAAARRELEEEAGVTDVYLEQLYTFGALDRDPRERIVTVAYYALAKLSDHGIRAATDAMGVGWFSLDALPKLAIAHQDIVDRAVDRLRGKVRYTPNGFELLSPRFSGAAATLVWHPANHASFGSSWSVHCGQGTHGALLHAELDRARISV